MPAPGWKPPPDWPTAPSGWTFLTEDTAAQPSPGNRRNRRANRQTKPDRPFWRRHTGWVVVAAVALLGLVGGFSGFLVLGGTAAAMLGIIRLIRAGRRADARRARGSAVAATVAGLAVAAGDAAREDGDDERGVNPDGEGAAVVS